MELHFIIYALIWNNIDLSDINFISDYFKSSNTDTESNNIYEIVRF